MIKRMLIVYSVAGLYIVSCVSLIAFQAPINNVMDFFSKTLGILS